jgi:death-on-curing protein
MIEEPEFLTFDEVLGIHAQQLDIWGGSEGLRDEGLLRSALAQPEASFDGRFLCEDLFAMAAAYAFHVAENQPFVDGNKRTGLECATSFLRLNGYHVAERGSLLSDAMHALADKSMAKADLAALFRKLTSR